jgi:hypothetical protein
MKNYEVKLCQGFLGGTLDGKKLHVDGRPCFVRVKSTGELYGRFTMSPNWTNYSEIPANQVEEMLRCAASPPFQLEI